MRVSERADQNRSIRRFRAIVAVSLCVLAATLTARAPAQDEAARIEALLARMTLEEKFGQLQQLDGLAEGSIRPEHVELARKGLLGSTLNVRGAANVNALQQVAVEESRLKIPLIFAFDVIHGYRTIFPIPLGEAASWDPAAAERSAAIAAAEARAAGLHWTFAPMVDIARDARWGRIAEGAGEDPFLGAALARARVRGFQGDDYSPPDRIVACAKHWVAYGAAEAGRDYNTVDISERTLRTIYFPPFKAALDAGVGTFMSAFNDLNGVPASANPWTLDRGAAPRVEIRRRWSSSDYTSVVELIKHGIAADEADAARAGAAGRRGHGDGEPLLRHPRAAPRARTARCRSPSSTRRSAGCCASSCARVCSTVPMPIAARERDGDADARRRDRPRARLRRDRWCCCRNERVLPLDPSRSPRWPSSARSPTIAGEMLGNWTGDGRPDDAVYGAGRASRRRVSPRTEVTYAAGVAIDVPALMNDDGSSASRRSGRDRRSRQRCARRPTRSSSSSARPAR